MAKPLRLSRRFSESFKHTSLDHTLTLLTLPSLTMERANIVHSNEKFHQRKLKSSCIVIALMPRKTFRFGTIIFRSHVQQTLYSRRKYVNDGSQTEVRAHCGRSRGLLCRGIKTGICPLELLSAEQ